MPASNDVSSVGIQREPDRIDTPGGCILPLNSEEVLLTCFSPDRQIFILLDVQHQLQAVAHTSLGVVERRAPIFTSIKGVTLSISGKNLRKQKPRQKRWPHIRYFYDSFYVVPRLEITLG